MKCHRSAVTAPLLLAAATLAAGCGAAAEARLGGNARDAAGVSEAGPAAREHLLYMHAGTAKPAEDADERPDGCDKATDGLDAQREIMRGAASYDAVTSTKAFGHLEEAFDAYQGASCDATDADAEGDEDCPALLAALADALTTVAETDEFATLANDPMYRDLVNDYDEAASRSCLPRHGI